VKLTTQGWENKDKTSIFGVNYHFNWWLSLWMCQSSKKKVFIASEDRKVWGFQTSVSTCGWASMDEHDEHVFINKSAKSIMETNKQHILMWTYGWVSTNARIAIFTSNVSINTFDVLTGALTINSELKSHVLRLLGPPRQTKQSCIL